MGGVAKGVFRDFRMGRVSEVHFHPKQLKAIMSGHDSEVKAPCSRRLTPFPIVPISDECAGREYTRGEESQLVMCCT